MITWTCASLQGCKQVLANFIHSQMALCNHYETTARVIMRSTAFGGVMLHIDVFSYSSALNSPPVSSTRFISSGAYFIHRPPLILLSPCRTCMWTSTASCRWAIGCWSRVTTPPSRSSRSRASWRRSGKPLLRRWTSAAPCWRCLPVFTRNATRWEEKLFRTDF